MSAPDFPGPDHRADVTPNRVISDPRIRQYIYGAVAAIAAVIAGLVVFDIITQEQVEEWATLTVAFVGIGASLLAAANVPPAE